MYSFWFLRKMFLQFKLPILSNRSGPHEKIDIRFYYMFKSIDEE